MASAKANLVYESEGPFTPKRVKTRKARATAPAKPTAPKAPAKFVPSAQADRYRLTDAELTEWTALDSAKARHAYLAKMTPTTSTTSPVTPTLDAWHLALARWTDLAGDDGTAFAVATSEASDGFLVIPRDPSGASDDDDDIADLFVLPESDDNADDTPESSDTDAPSA